MKLNEIKIRPTLVIFIVFIITLIISGFLDVNNNLLNKKYYTYSEVNEKYSEKIINNNFIKQNVIPRTDGLKYYAIPYKSSDNVSGSINLKIRSNTNNEIFNKQYNFSDIAKNEKLSFDLDNIVLHKDNDYEFEFTFNLDNNIIFNIDNNNNIKAEQILEFNNKIILQVLSLIILISTIILCIAFNIKKDMKIDKVYLGVSLLIGLYVIILSPPFTAPDEARHFNRAYDIAQGNIISKEFNNELHIPVTYLPKEISDLKNIGIQKNNSIYVENSSPIIIESLLDEINGKITNEKAEFSLNGTSIINPIAYLPQAIFIKLGIILNLSPLLILYMARLGNLLLWILTVYMSIRFTPKFKLLFCVTALMPGMTLLASSCSTDSVLMSVVISFISYIFYLKYKQKDIYTKKNIILMILFSVLLASIKLPYVLFMVLVLIVKDENRFNKKNILLIVGSIIVGVLSYKIWDLVGCVTSNQGIGKEYIKFVIKNPTKFMQLMIFNLRDGIGGYITHIFSGNAWNYSANGLLTMSYLIVFIVVGIKSSSLQIITTKFDKAIIIIIGSMLFASICFVAFTWRPVDFGSLWGIQGRYFIPLMPLIGVMLASNKDNYEEIGVTPYVINYLVWTITATSFTLIKCNFLV